MHVLFAVLCSAHVHRNDHRCTDGNDGVDGGVAPEGIWMVKNGAADGTEFEEETRQQEPSRCRQIKAGRGPHQARGAGLSQKTSCQYRIIMVMMNGLCLMPRFVYPVLEVFGPPL
jgi:hypothetical protein